MIRTFCIKRLALPFCVILLALGIRPAMAAEVHFNSVNAHVAGGPALLAGGGTMTRTRQSVSVNLAITGLDQNAAYTVWWIIFNDPTNCTDPCNQDDDRNVLNATGFVTGDDGTANVTAHLAAGDAPDGQQVLRADSLLTNGLNRGAGLKAEIHVVVRSHGGASVGDGGEQISLVNGACNPVCMDQQGFAFFPPHPHP